MTFATIEATCDPELAVGEGWVYFADLPSAMPTEPPRPTWVRWVGPTDGVVTISVDMVELLGPSFDNLPWKLERTDERKDRDWTHSTISFKRAASPTEEERSC